MTAVDQALRALHRSERRLGAHLRAVADRHRVEHEVHHVALDVAGWCDEHVRRIAHVAAGRGLRLSPSPARRPAAVRALARGASTALGRRRATGALLLADLRALHLRATGVADDWEVLGQAASTLRDAGLRELVGSCRPRAERIAHWAETQLAEQAPQVVAS
jgi:hypothetical protein